MAKCMVIVDVQGEFHHNGYTNEYLFDKEYIRRIRETIKRNNITSVFFVYDCNSGVITIPNGFLKIEQECYTKRYFKHYAGYELSMIEDYIEKGEARVVDDEAYEIYDRLYIKTYNAHETQEVNESLENLVDELRGYEKTYICGGADGECLHDMEKMLEYFNISFEKKNNLVYPLPVIKSRFESWEFVEIESDYI